MLRQNGKYEITDDFKRKFNRNESKMSLNSISQQLLKHRKLYYPNIRRFGKTFAIIR